MFKNMKEVYTRSLNAYDSIYTDSKSYAIVDTFLWLEDINWHREAGELLERTIGQVKAQKILEHNYRRGHVNSIGVTMTTLFGYGFENDSGFKNYCGSELVDDLIETIYSEVTNLVAPSWVE